ncbi:phosphatase PAP2 family protein [Flavihumibacter sp. ZG627]|uniref:phosphatase PAP2 family protein n=1 Tax=Flavihumibacter sp. ZG627 TaxID=1463156 RepID=UPI00057E27EE|nr:phosphatase PAP2 family protein [Flavihumibacter sp. ZG627]KIC90285.1 hypothetical protein HY58_09930 [Flavihumibacter sp. ZG627]
MQVTKSFILLFGILIFLTSFLKAQVTDSVLIPNKITISLQPKIHWQLAEQNKPFNIKPYIIPGLMVAYGFSAIENDGLKEMNAEIKDEMYAEHPHNKLRIDDYLQFAPAVIVFGIDATGIKAKHNLRDRTMLFLMSNIITNASVFSIKNLSHQLRPDGSAYTSFPSGHTAEAFANAEFLRQEYKNVSPWYGVAGYAIAATTGYLRLYNNKHWISDVVAGAGVGIASTRLAYWLYPKIQHILFKDTPMNTLILPSYQNGSVGLGMFHRFR